MSGTAVGKPTSVSVVIVLTIINGALEVISGVVLLALAGNNNIQDVMDTDSAGTIRAIGITGLIVGLIILAIARMLSSGSNGGRILVSLAQVLSLIAGIYGIIALGAAQIPGEITGIVISLIVLFLLWNGKANEFFTR